MNCKDDPTNTPPYIPLLPETSGKENRAQSESNTVSTVQASLTNREVTMDYIAQHQNC